jgi:hypothetical protein
MTHVQFQETFSCQEDKSDLGHLLYIYVLLNVLFRLRVGPVGFLFQSVSSTTIHIRFYLFWYQATYTTLSLLTANL